MRWVAKWRGLVVTLAASASETAATSTLKRTMASASALTSMLTVTLALTTVTGKSIAAETGTSNASAARPAPATRSSFDTAARTTLAPFAADRASHTADRSASTAAAPAVTPPGERAPSPPWTFAGLPDQQLPRTRFDLVDDDGRPVLRVRSTGAYGNLVHRLPDAAAGTLSWRWRVTQPLAAADLRRREGDDVAVKVCALFAMPRERVPFVERQLLRIAEARTGESLPTATLCYVWDPSWPNGSIVPNAYSRRVRYLTLGRPGDDWQTERRDLAADFIAAFGDESTTAPPLSAIGVGADADNTQGRSEAFVDGLVLAPGR